MGVADDVLVDGSLGAGNELLRLCSDSSQETRYFARSWNKTDRCQGVALAGLGEMLLARRPRRPGTCEMSISFVESKQVHLAKLLLLLQPDIGGEVCCDQVCLNWDCRGEKNAASPALPERESRM